MIHPTAIVSTAAQLGKNVHIGAYSIVNAGVHIGDDTVIESHCEIGHASALAEDQPLLIGKRSLIRSHSIFYVGSTFGDDLVTGHRVTVREKTHAGCNLQIGTMGDILGNCVIGDYVRFHSSVFVADHSRIGDFVWLFPRVVLTNDPHPPSEVRQGVVISDYVAIAANSVVLPGIEIGTGSLVGAQSVVTRNVEAGVVVAGSPAKRIGEAGQIQMRDGSGSAAYPWRRHFTRGYPAEIVDQWFHEFNRNA